MSLYADVLVHRGGFRLAATLRAEPGEVLAVLGPNGAGKSTLLNVLAGLLRPDRAVVRVGERTLVDIGAAESAGVHLPPHRRAVGLLSQQPLLFPHLSAVDNVAFGPRSHSISRRAAERLARRWLSEVDAATLAGHRPAQLSGGQAQRVALARALATEPELMLLDEPFAALDVTTAPALRGLVRRVLRDGARPAAAVLVTHDPLDALVLADRVLVLDAGRIVEQGPTREVLARPRTPFTARIAGLNLVAGRACAGGLRTADGTVVAGTAGEPVTDGEPAVAVFQPAAVAVHIDRTQGSPRNVVAATVSGMEPHGEMIRLRVASAPGGPEWVAGIAADLTPAAVAELAIEPGRLVHLAVKAAEVTVFGAGAAGQ